MHAGTARDYRRLARRRLPRMVFDYIDGGAFDERTLGRNETDLAAVRLRQRVLNDCGDLTLSTRLFGQDLAMPVILAPVGMAGMYARRGEVQAARAAQGAGVPFCLSTVSVCPIEEVANAVSTPPWFQLYMIKDRGRLSDLLARAQALAAPPLVFTVDMAVPGLRYRDFRSGFAGEPSLSRSLQRMVDGAAHPGWAWDLFVHGRPHSFGNLKGVEARGPGRERGLAAYWTWIRDNFDPSATWKDMDWLRAHWKGPIILKGVLDAEDARRAEEAGADGLIVSNHGGRQLDSAPSSITALPAVVDAVGGRMTVLMDGGIRSGLDILKARALGADACLIGRAWAWALAAEGERGVARLLATLRQELTVAMALTGCRDIAKAGRDLIAF